MNYFKPEEFNCPCCGANQMSDRLYEKVDKLRSDFGSALHINSGYRCSKHNAQVGGKPDSQHLYGKAVDISTANMTDEMRHQFMVLVHLSFNGIGVGKNFVHMDIRDRPALWVY